MKKRMPYFLLVSILAASCIGGCTKAPTVEETTNRLINSADPPAGETNIEKIPFCEQEIATSVLKIICNSEKLENISKLERFTNLELLVLNNTAVTDFTPIGQMSKLKELVISGTEARNITFLKSLTSLRSLNLTYTKVSNLKPIADLTQLEELLIHNTDVKDLRPLRNLTSLKTLSIGEKVKDITILRSLPNLEELALVGTKLGKRPLKALRKANPNLNIVK